MTFRNPFRKEKPEEPVPHPDGPSDAWLVSPRGPLRRERVPASESFARWQAHRERFAETGLWPVLVPIEHVDVLELGVKREGQNVEGAVARGLNFDVRDYVSEALADMAEDEEAELDLDFDPAALVPDPVPPVEAQIVAVSEPLRKNVPNAELWVALLPCREPWEAPAVLGYGGWNACPMPEVHVAVMREWYTRHGAVPLVIGPDTIEMLARPIEDREEAKRTAIEQYAYCSDIVDQGVGTVEELAAALLGASTWFFWWD